MGYDSIKRYLHIDSTVIKSERADIIIEKINGGAYEQGMEFGYSLFGL